MRAWLAVLLLVGATSARAAGPATGAPLASMFATPVLSAESESGTATLLRGAASVPELWLAQRSIDRDWGLAEDSTYRTIDVQGWKSEGLAMALSGALPGAGELYAGESSGWFFLAGEALGWVGRTLTRQKGDDLREQAAAFIGDPNDSLSTWSFARYEASSGGSAAALEALWNGDREAYYQTLANDATYRTGFEGDDPGVNYESYRGLRVSSQDRLRQSRLLEVALWANHAISAFDALRAARFHNLPLRRTIDLKLGARIRRGEPSFRAALVRRF